MALLHALLAQQQPDPAILPDAVKDYDQDYLKWLGSPGTTKYDARKLLALESFYHILYELVEMPPKPAPGMPAPGPRPLGTILERLVKYQSIIQNLQANPLQVDPLVQGLREQLRKAMVEALRDKLMVAAP